MDTVKKSGAGILTSALQMFSVLPKSLGLGLTTKGGKLTTTDLPPPTRYTLFISKE
jgi:hypothetical protein